MNANGVISNANVAGVSSTAGASSAGAGKTSSSDAFAGALVQALEGTGSSGTSAAGSAIPAGLAGLLGLLGTSSADASSQDLLKLLAGLAEQLKAMDPNAQLPSQTEDQLAVMLQMFQNLLMQTNGTQLLGAMNAGSTGDPANQAAEGANLTIQSMTSPTMPLIQALQQSVQQLTARLNSGETFPGQMSALKDQVQAALNMLVSQPSSDKASAGEEAHAATTAAASADATAKSAASVSTAENGESEQLNAAASPEIRRTVVPLRNPVWHLQLADGAAANHVDTQPAVNAVESADASGQNGSAPAWTFLKGDSSSIPTNAAVNPQLPAQVPVQQFAEQIGKYLVKQFILTQGNGTSEAKISLHPEHLGQVDIKIILQNGQLTAQFVTQHGAARDMLENQMSQLRAALQGQGLQVDKMEVVQQPSSSATTSFFQQNQGQSGSGYNGGGSGSRSSRGVYEDTAGFEAELDRSTYLREIGYGSSLNVTA